MRKKAALSAHSPPPQDTEHPVPFLPQRYRSFEHDEPSPPQTPHSSTLAFEPISRLQPTLCANKNATIIQSCAGRQSIPTWTDGGQRFISSAKFEKKGLTIVRQSDLQIDDLKTDTLSNYTHLNCNRILPESSVRPSV